MNPRITLVTLGVDSVDDAVSFYRDGLGFPMQDREEGSDIAFFALEGTWLAVYPRTLLAEDAGVGDPDEESPQSQSRFSGVTLAHNVSTKGEVDAVLAEAEAAGGRIVTQARETFWGGYSGYFTDLDGHYWEVAYPPLTGE
ncbi:VOC family protein [Halogeometricum limi]|uniref:VOC domain-containing protein n=1 Tax=Halogeometricum limi TaxID=555875 RepID=A0A1I6I9T7_9EURY|nr:VOC family protein [Halogeometricum limi]SFR63140.1 hypothetical protein SAMN04488124_2864 [Halogeometricum limi]